MTKIVRLLYSIIIFAAADSFFFFKSSHHFAIIPLLAAAFLLVNIVVAPFNKNIPHGRLKLCFGGTSLLVEFIVSVIFSAAYHAFLFFSSFGFPLKNFVISILIVCATESVVFWNGIARVYVSSVQLGIKHRVLGIIFGWVPVANIIMLCKIIRISSDEVKFESDKITLDNSRQSLQVCKLKYPVLLVHGVFFRDSSILNYWGRIPAELQKNGAVIFYGNHRSAASVKDCAAEIAKRIDDIIKDTGCEKVNIIAHSKGGLDSRYALSCLGMSDRVASLTTINTPHRGCLFADYLLDKLPSNIRDNIASTYNNALNKLGEPDSDFIAAVSDLTAKACTRLNDEMPPFNGVFCQSFGSKLNHASSGRFPLNFSYHLVRHFGGNNDGLVSESSFEWGQKYSFLTVKGKRGISHADMIDLNRENIPGFDVREFYVNILSELKNLGF